MTRVRLGAISFLDRNLKTFGVMFILCFTFNQPDLQIFCIKKKKSAYSSRMKNRNVKCSFKGETNDFPSSGGGNHLDQSVLWHRDVIKLLMSLNEITCDPVARSFYSGATALFLCFMQSQNGRKKKTLEEQKVRVIKAERRVFEGRALWQSVG